MTIRIYPTLWDHEMHARSGAPNHLDAARALFQSGYRVVIHPDRKMSDSTLPVSFDTDEEGLAVAWLIPGIDDDGPVQ